MAKISPNKRTVKLPYRKDENGHHLCRWCGTPVPKGRIWWCSQECVDEYREHYDLKYIKRKIRKRDRGICAMCGADTTKMRKEIEQKLSLMSPQEKKDELDRLGIRKRWPCKLWEADHIIPVCEGGGGCDYTGYRTLCIWCHRKISSELRKKRSDERKAQGIKTVRKKSTKTRRKRKR